MIANTSRVLLSYLRPSEAWWPRSTAIPSTATTSSALQSPSPSFGVPAAQIALLHKDVVDQRGWISQDRFLHALNTCLLLPGPEAAQLVSYAGWCCMGPGAASWSEGCS